MPPTHLIKDKAALIQKLDAAKADLDLYLNAKKDPLALNRLEKFLRHPKKVTRVALYKIGLVPSPDVRATMFWGAPLTLPAWDEDAVLAYYTGSLGGSEISLVRFLIRTLEAGDVFFDIGSSLGLYTALGEALGATVHSFEPNPKAVAYTKQNAAASTTVNSIALAEKSGEAVLYDISAGNKSGMSSFFPDIKNSNADSARGIRVTTITLDEYCSREQAIPKVIKMDVMNADFLVLQGAKNLLTAHAPVLALRIYNTPSAVERTRASLALLKEHGYDAFSIQDGGELAPTDIRPETLKFASTFIFQKHA